MLYMILSEKQKLTALFVLTMSGILGWSTLSLGIKESLFPLLTGLFGGSSLILGIKNKVKINKQDVEKVKINGKEMKKPVLGALATAPLCSFLPGMGSGQAAILGSRAMGLKEEDDRKFLVHDVLPDRKKKNGLRRRDRKNPRG